MKEVTREKDNSQMVVTGDEPMGNAEEVEDEGQGQGEIRTTITTKKL